MSRFTKAFLTLIALLIAGALLLTGNKGKALHQDHALTSGYVLKWLPGLKGGGKVEFTYAVDGVRYTELCAVPLPRCPQALDSREAEYRDVRFPVAYQPQEPGNAEILLYANQFKAYGPPGSRFPYRRDDPPGALPLNGQSRSLAGHMTYVEDQTIQGVVHAVEPLPLAQYEGCRFVRCDFSGGDLGGYRFLDCHFTDCNWSNVRSTATSLQGVRFTGCKLLGVDFGTCDRLGFAVNFQGCTLDHASFHGVRLAGTAFTESSLVEVDFSGADLGKSSFDGCRLSRAAFEDADLRGADLRNAEDYTIDPGRTRLKGAKFSLPAVVGLLRGHGIIIEA